jgi:hypothetical protein
LLSDFKAGEGGLDSVSGAKDTKADVEEIGFGRVRKAKSGHGLMRRRWKVELLTDALKNIALSNAAGMTFFNGALQCRKLSIVSLFPALESPQCCANDFTGVLVASTLNRLQHKEVKLIGQIDVTGWHYRRSFAATARITTIGSASSIRVAKRLAVTEWPIAAQALEKFVHLERTN